jgi:hypothetical protein
MKILKNSKVLSALILILLVILLGTVDLHLLSIKIKDQDKLKDMDEKWKILCEDLEWLFISSED